VKVYIANYLELVGMLSNLIECRSRS